MKKKLFAFAFFTSFVFTLNAQNEDLSFVMQKDSLEKKEIPSYSVEKNIVIDKDEIRLALDSTTGAFSLYALPEKGHEIALLSSYDSGSASFFALKAGRKEYKLARGTGIKTECRRTPLGAQMAYLVPNVAQVVVDFSFLPSIPNSTRTDMLRVTVYTINLGKNIQSFALKGVFDTVLGENTSAHFSTAARSKVNSETLFTDMSDDLWIRSSNAKASVQFLLEGAGISRPCNVVLANKENLVNSSGWIPPVQHGKSFTSVLSYNNSALCINWDTAYLDPLKTSAVGFFISVATDGELPAGKKFLSDLANRKTMLGIYSKVAVPTTNVAPAPTPLTPQEAGLSEKEIHDYTKNGTPFVEVTEEQLDPEYIQNLLDHIASLSNDVDKEELARLNSELDSILAKLGVQR